MVRVKRWGGRLMMSFSYRRKRFGNIDFISSFSCCRNAFLHYRTIPLQIKTNKVFEWRYLILVQYPICWQLMTMGRTVTRRYNPILKNCVSFCKNSFGWYRYNCLSVNTQRYKRFHLLFYVLLSACYLSWLTAQSFNNIFPFHWDSFSRWQLPYKNINMITA